MLGGSSRFRVLAIVLVLVVTCAACQIDVRLVTEVNDDGSGRFSLRFVIDKELVDLARNAGEDPFTALACPAELEDAGWECGRSTEGGGLTISLDRAFRSHTEFNQAMEDLERLAAEQEGPTAQFFKLRITRDGGFLKTSTAIEGSVDLTSSGVLGNASPEDRATLETIITEAAGEFFRFGLEAELPGSVSATTGDPEEVEGGKVTWRPRLGRMLTFRAESSAYNVGSLAVIGGPALALLVLLAWMLFRRTRGSRTVPEPATGPPAEPPAL